MIVGDKIAFLVAFLNSSLFRYCFTNNFPSLGEKGREVRKIFMDKIPVLQVSDEENSKFIPIIKDIQTEYGSFNEYLKTYTGEEIIYENDKTTSPLSEEISKDLKRKGMKFVGSTIIYSYLQAIGIIYSHDKECFLYKE